jgi:hypothetical protein
MSPNPINYFIFFIFDGIEFLLLVSGGEFASTFDNLEFIKRGYWDLIEEILIGGYYYLFGFGCKLWQLIAW